MKRKAHTCKKNKEEEKILPKESTIKIANPCKFTRDIPKKGLPNVFYPGYVFTIRMKISNGTIYFFMNGNIFNAYSVFFVTNNGKKKRVWPSLMVLLKKKISKKKTDDSFHIFHVCCNFYFLI